MILYKRQQDEMIELKSLRGEKTNKMLIVRMDLIESNF